MRKYLVCVLIFWLCCFSVFAQNSNPKPPIGTPINWGDRQADGLVNWWLFQEGSGDKVYDLTGNYTGTLTAFTWPNTTTSGWNPGRFGRTLAYITNDYVDCGNPPSMGATFTVSFWCKLNGFSANATPVSYVNAAASQGWMFYTDTLGNKMYFFVYNFAADFAVYTPLTVLDEWHHWVGVSDPLYTSLYRDGVLVGKSTKGGGAYNHSVVSLRIGRYGPMGNYLNGMVDDVRIYDVAKTDSEIFDMYMNTGRLLRQPLVDYWTGLSQAIGRVIIIQ